MCTEQFGLVKNRYEDVTIIDIDSKGSLYYSYNKMTDLWYCLDDDKAVGHSFFTWTDGYMIFLKTDSLNPNNL